MRGQVCLKKLLLLPKAENNFEKKLKLFVTSKKAKVGKLLASRNFVNLVKSVREILRTSDIVLKSTLNNLIEKDRFG